MPRIYGLIVAKNEASRYLSDCLAHMVPLFDAVHLFDDQSDDGTPDIARSLGCTVQIRADGQPSFLEHEGQFRSAAWESMQTFLKPRTGEWVFSFDADEFLVSQKGEARQRMEAAIIEAHIAGCDSVRIPIAEIFDISSNGLPRRRVDGFWSRIDGLRMGRIQGRSSEFRDKAMGCGSLPCYAYNPYRSKDDLYLLHYGYAMYEDRCSKYDRYINLKNHGHNESHIQSIIREPMLENWNGPIPSLGVHVER